jgi:hypothetical protein
MMNKFLTMAFLIGFIFQSSQAFADYGLEVGVRQQSGDVSGGTAQSQMGMQFGATAHFPIQGKIFFRTGMLYTQRPLVIDGTPDVKTNMSYLDVPLALMFKFEDYAGVFGGVSLALNLDKSSDSGTMTAAASSIMPIVFGLNFKFAPNLGATLYYENANGEAGKWSTNSLKDYRSVGANLMFTFD